MINYVTIHSFRIYLMMQLIGYEVGFPYISVSNKGEVKLVSTKVGIKEIKSVRFYLADKYKLYYKKTGNLIEPMTTFDKYDSSSKKYIKKGVYRISIQDIYDMILNDDYSTFYCVNTKKRDKEYDLWKCFQNNNVYFENSEGNTLFVLYTYKFGNIPKLPIDFIKRCSENNRPFLTWDLIDMCRVLNKYFNYYMLPYITMKHNLRYMDISKTYVLHNSYGMLAFYPENYRPARIQYDDTDDIMMGKYKKDMPILKEIYGYKPLYISFRAMMNNICTIPRLEDDLKNVWIFKDITESKLTVASYADIIYPTLYMDMQARTYSTNGVILDDTGVGIERKNYKRHVLEIDISAYIDMYKCRINSFIEHNYLSEKDITNLLIG